MSAPTTYPPLPDVPACWSWELPPLPQPSTRGALIRWQDHRCAICGLRKPGSGGYTTGLHEDHDHHTGDTRGYLCARCNAYEGWSSAAVFTRYRERPPTQIIGVLLRYQCHTHPSIRAAETAWKSAVSKVEELIDAEQEHVTKLRVARGMREAGYDHPDPIRIRQAVSPLVVAAIRTGHRLNERAEMRMRDTSEFPDLMPLARAQVMDGSVPTAVLGDGDNALRGAL